MDWLIRNAIASALMPLGLLLLMALWGLAIVRRWPSAGKSLIAWPSSRCMRCPRNTSPTVCCRPLEPPARDPLADRAGQAIVVLGAGTYFRAPEYGADTVNARGLVRMRYAAHLHRATAKPILATGGRFFHEIIGITWYQLQFGIARWR